jgi:hypothetical protein
MARSVYSRGHDDSLTGLKSVEDDWGQIQQWQDCLRAPFCWRLYPV